MWFSFNYPSIWNQQYIIPCRLSNKTLLAQLQSTPAPENPKVSCGCFPQCNVRDFDIQTSQAKWPTHNNWKQKAHEFEINYDYLKEGAAQNEEALEKHVFKSVAKIEVYIRTKSKEVVEEVPKYNGISGLMIALGSALAFCMGLSFIMIFELLELLIDFTMFGWTRIGLCRRKKPIISNVVSVKWLKMKNLYHKGF